MVKGRKINTDVSFRRLVRRFYRTRGRHDLPWRLTTDPYAILVSEIMLQQTQVKRVIPKYEAFLATFPTIESLARASLAEVLRHWQGLGYNRRAKYLHQTARQLMETWGGEVPSDYRALRTLPGFGDYTAKAVLAFAYSIPVALIETNVRAVFLHHYFPNTKAVPDTAILPLIARTLPRTHIREWYAALMDYGSYLKERHENPGRRSQGHKVQSRFSGSDRQIRGKILALCIASTGGVTLVLCRRVLEGVEDGRIREQLTRLCREKLLVQKSGRFFLPT